MSKQLWVDVPFEWLTYYPGGKVCFLPTGKPDTVSIDYDHTNGIDAPAENKVATIQVEIGAAQKLGLVPTTPAEPKQENWPCAHCHQYRQKIKELETQLAAAKDEAQQAREKADKSSELAEKAIQAMKVQANRANRLQESLNNVLAAQRNACAAKDADRRQPASPEGPGATPTDVADSLAGHAEVAFAMLRVVDALAGLRVACRSARAAKPGNHDS